MGEKSWQGLEMTTRRPKRVTVIVRKASNPTPAVKPAPSRAESSLRTPGGRRRGLLDLGGGDQEVEGLGADAFGPGVPGVGELLDELGVFPGEVGLLGAIVLQVEEFPGDLVGLAFAPDEFPIALAHPAGSLVFEEEDALGESAAGGGGEEGNAGHGLDGGALALLGILRAGGLADSGEEVHDVGGVGDDVGEQFLGLLVAKVFRPVQDEGAGDAAFMAEVFVHVEGGVAEVGPGGAVGMVGVGLAHAVEGGAGVEGGEAEAGGAIEAEGTPLVAGAVVAGEEDEGVVELAVLFQVGEDAAHAEVDVFDHGGEGGHAPGEVLATIGGEGIPGGVGLAGEAVGDGFLIDGDLGARREFGVGGDEAEFFLPLETPGAEDIPALAVGGHVAVDGFLGGLDGEVGGGVGEVEEPRFGMRNAECGIRNGNLAGLFEKLEGVVGEDVGDVKVVGGVGEFGFGGGGEADILGGVPLVLGVGEEVFVAEVVLKAARDGSGGAHVPLADHPGGIAGGTEDFGHGGGVGQEVAGVGGGLAGAGFGIGEGADAGLVGVQAGHEGGPGGAAAGRVVEGGKTQAAGGEAVDVGRGDLAAETTEVGVAKVVGQDDEDVGAAFRRRSQSPESREQKGEEDVESADHEVEVGVRECV